jgi:hypothetical protein
MTTNQTVVFIKAFSCCIIAMRWNTFADHGGARVDLIKCFRQIDEATLKTVYERFCKAGEVDAHSCAKQNNKMMAICLAGSLMAQAQARLLTYRNKYTFDSVECAILMYEIIMMLATIDSIATMQTLRENLQNLGVFCDNG